MKHLLMALTALFISNFVKAQNPNPSSVIDNYILSEMNSEKSPGMSTLIVKNGEIVWIESYGLADVSNNIQVSDSTVFLMASVSKLFTGTALMKLHEDGLINMDEGINKYLPFNIDIPNYVSDSITFRMLMTHTSSIKDNDVVMDDYYSTGDPTISLANVIQRYFSVNGVDYDANNNFSNSAPGSTYDYSNMATALAGYLVERVSGMPFNVFCNLHIFDKLCLTNTSWYLADFDTNRVARPYQWLNNNYVPYAHYGFADYPDGQLRSNVMDLAKFTIAYLQLGAFNNQQLLSETSINEMLSLQIPNIDGTQGLNWYTEQINLTAGGTVNVWGHNGGESGVSTDLYINPANKIGVVVLSNGEGDNTNVVNKLYNYALTLNTSGVGNPSCSAISSTNTIIDKSQFVIRPNPTNGTFSIESDFDTIDTVEIFNSLGKPIESKSRFKSKLELNIAVAGLYFIRITDMNGKNYISKLMVN